MDISNPLNLQVTGQFVVLMNSVDDYPARNAPRDLKVSAVSWVSENKLLFWSAPTNPVRAGPSWCS